MKPSLQFASYKKDVQPLKQEYAVRKENGFTIDWVDSDDIKRRFGITKNGGILSNDGGVVNAYLLTHGLLQDAASKGIKLFDNTTITGINLNKKKFSLITDTGFIITANKLVIACGYESQHYLSKPVETWHSTYAIISEPLLNDTCWHKNAVIWETASPYLYLRTTADKRILVGGLDDDFYDPVKRDQHVYAKAKRLQSKFNMLFPHLPFKTDFQWAGTFAGTKDSLPYIGTAELPNIILP